jgi:hypothetical protein
MTNVGIILTLINMDATAIKLHPLARYLGARHVVQHGGVCRFLLLKYNIMRYLIYNFSPQPQCQESTCSTYQP